MIRMFTISIIINLRIIKALLTDSFSPIVKLRSRSRSSPGPFQIYFKSFQSIVKLQLISQLKSTQLNVNNLRDELGVDAIFTVPPTHH